MLGAAAERLDRWRNHLESRRQEHLPPLPPGVELRAHLRASAARRFGYVVDDAWEERVHGLLGAPWPCPERPRFEALWDAVVGELDAASRDGDGAHLDADRGLGRAVWCCVRHSGARRVVETGVGRGVTSRLVLEALAGREGAGLWSVDLAPREPEVAALVGAAVPERLRGRWTFVEGSSRRRLPPVLRSLGAVDVFVHDSHHTAPTMRFEFRAAWPRLTAGGVLLSDDVHDNAAWGHLARRVPAGRSLVALQEDKAALFGVAVR